MLLYFMKIFIKILKLDREVSQMVPIRMRKIAFVSCRQHVRFTIRSYFPDLKLKLLYDPTYC